MSDCENMRDVDYSVTDKQLQNGLKCGRFVITILGIERKCSRCGELYPNNPEFYYSYTRKDNSHSVVAHCRACELERKSIYRNKK